MAQDSPDSTAGEPDAELTTVVQDTAAQDQAAVDGGLTPTGERDFTVPTLDDVRAKIEGRVAKAGGQAELDALSAEGRRQARTDEDRAKAAQDVLAQIRASMKNG